MLQPKTPPFLAPVLKAGPSLTGYTSVHFPRTIQPKKVLPEILFVTSVPPRACGIATYSQDLVNALIEQFENTFKCSFCALESHAEEHHYNDEPKYILNTDKPNSFAHIAQIINQDVTVKLLVIQHEFGFFAANASDFDAFYETINVPKVFVFHTVLPNPDAELKARVLKMARAASSLVVMTKHAAQILQEDYQITENKIAIIHHGTHLVPAKNRKLLKQNYNLSNRKVLSTFGLIGSSKSIETTLDALPEIIKKHPEVVFLVLGRTHPNIVKNDGEVYRDMLEQRVRDLDLASHVCFVNEYLPLPTLLEYLQLSDIYLFTSKDKNQAVSGTFAYAISSGCPVISTPIPHAKEILTDNNGIIIDFESSEQLAQAVINLLDNTQKRIEISSNGLHKMAATAWQNSAIAHGLLFRKQAATSFPLNYKAPKINLDHVRNMTTNFGMIQFSRIAQPDLSTGYTLDDNARALIALCQKYALDCNDEDLELIYTYFKVVKFCMQKDGTFLNYINQDLEFTTQNDNENLEDSNGRAIWALGYVSSLKNVLPISLTSEAEFLINYAYDNLHEIHSTRAMAFIIKGLHLSKDEAHLKLVEILSKRLVQMYKHEKSDDWYWYESYLTYGNSILPEAMLCAYLATNNLEYKKIALESFNFLLSKLFVDGQFKVISNKGWHLKDENHPEQVGGEQPIDTAYTIMALERFYQAFGIADYKRKAHIAFTWFLGENHLQQTVYNPSTGGCYDGLEEFNVNLNQGAESTLSYLFARLSHERFQIAEEKRNLGMECLNIRSSVLEKC